MSSGINWKYQISNANSEEPPIRYSIGIEWASGSRSELTIGLTSGLAAVRTAYASLPGLAGHRNLWLRARLSGPEQVTDTAAKYLLDIFAKKSGKKTPLIHGGVNIEKETVRGWIINGGFICGREIAEYAGVALDAPFLENWELLAIAAEEYPRNRWGICPKVTKLKVETLPLFGERRQLEKAEADRVLYAASAWSQINFKSEREKADADLVQLLDDKVVKGAK